MGSLLVQILASQGLAKMAVLLTPAAPSDVTALTFSTFNTYIDVTSKWGFWHKPQKLSFEKARYGLLNCMPEDRARQEYAGFTWESGRSAFELGFPLLDKAQAAKVDSAKVTCPLLVVAGAHDRIIPASVTKKVAEKYKQAQYKLYEKHGHFLFREENWEGQVGWKAIAEDINSWIDAENAMFAHVSETIQSAAKKL